MYKYQVIGSQSNKLYFESELHSTVFRWIQIEYPVILKDGRQKQAVQSEKAVPEPLLIKKVLPNKLV